MDTNRYIDVWIDANVYILNVYICVVVLSTFMYRYVFMHVCVILCSTHNKPCRENKMANTCAQKD